MIITKDFIVLNFPKTGSTYVRKVIKEVYDRRIDSNLWLKYFIKLNIIKPLYTELILPNIKFKKGLVNSKDQHGIYCQIPDSEKQKKIISVVRCPYERFFSIYEFQYWKQRPLLSKEILKNELPQYPDLSPDDFVDYLKLVAKYAYTDKPINLKVGHMSIQFIKFFFKNPQMVVENLTKEYLESNKLFLDDIGEIYFLKQNNLNIELAAFLYANGFTKSEIEFVKNHKKENITLNKSKDRESLISDKIINYIEEYEFFYKNVLKTQGIIFENNA